VDWEAADSASTATFGDISDVSGVPAVGVASVTGDASEAVSVEESSVTGRGSLLIDAIDVREREVSTCPDAVEMVFFDPQRALQSSTPKTLPVVFGNGLYPSEGDPRQMPEFADFAQPLAQSFSTELVSAIQSLPMPPLGEGSLHSALATLLNGGIGDHLIDVAPSRQMECLSGFWLVASDIHRSHLISQDLGSPEGSFLHGIMHRREGDFGNSKYWFRRVGSHPIFDQIQYESDGHFRDPFDFVDLCEKACQLDSGEELDRCIRSQWIEWQALMMYLVA
jgi:hypothetical protein